MKETKLLGFVGLSERFNLSFQNIDFSQNINKINIKRICRIPNNGNTNNIFYDLTIHDIDLLQFYFNSKFIYININDNIKKNNKKLKKAKNILNKSKNNKKKKKSYNLLKKKLINLRDYIKMNILLKEKLMILK